MLFCQYSSTDLDLKIRPMRTLIIGGVIFLMWCLLGRWYYVCEIQGLCGNDPIETAATPPLVEEGTVDLDAEEKISFDKKAIEPNWSDNQRNAISEIVAKMKADEAMNLKILGLYTTDERDVDAGLFENIGIARADAIRKMITAEDIAATRISLDATEDDNAHDNPIRFEFTKKVIEAAQYTFDNMTFGNITFASGDAQLKNPPRQFLLYADSLRSFLKVNPDRVLIVTGHTDDQGSENLNYKLGIRRGNTIEYFLRTQKGISVPIEVRSRGEKAPIADNSTAEGRRKNRRVQITIE